MIRFSYSGIVNYPEMPMPNLEGYRSRDFKYCKEIV